MPARNLVFVIGCLCLAAQASGQAPVGPVPAAVHEPAPVGAAAMPADGGYLYSEPALAESPATPSPDELPPIPAPWQRSAWPPKPRLQARFESVWLQPDFPQSDPLFVEIVTTGQGTAFVNPLPASQNSRFIAAARVTAEAMLSLNNTFEATGTYLGGPDHTSTLGDRDSRKLVIPTTGGFLGNLPAGFPADADVLSLGWNFEMVSADASVIHHWVAMNGFVSDVALGFGGRFFFVDERTNLRVIDELAPSTGGLRVETENLMAGPQFMGRVQFQGPWPRIRSSAEAKIALLTNATETETRVEVNDLTTSLGSFNRTQFAALFEGNFFVDFNITPNITVFGGVQLLYVSRIDRASDQYRQDVNVFTQSQKEIGTLWTYGPRGGIAIHY